MNPDWRIYEEIVGPRKEQFEAACQQMGIIQVQVQFVPILGGELILMTVNVHEKKPLQALQALMRSEQTFSHWLRNQLSALLGSNMQKLLTDPYADVVLDFDTNNRRTK